MILNTLYMAICALCLLPFLAQAGEQTSVKLSKEAFINSVLLNKQKKKNLIEMNGFGIDRHCSTVTETITLKSITVKLQEN